MYQLLTSPGDKLGDYLRGIIENYFNNSDWIGFVEMFNSDHFTSSYDYHIYFILRLFCGNKHIFI